MDVEDNTQIVLTFFAALARGDLAAAKAALAADVTWWMPSMWQTSGVSKSSDTIFDECVIGVGKGSRPPRPPNRAGGSPAHGSPVGSFLIGIGVPAHKL